MEAVGHKQLRRADYSLNKVGPSQLMWVHSHVM